MKKEITFFYSDGAQKNLYEPIINEAQKRGYATKLSDVAWEKCEIGIYSDHENFPQYSKFSVIMLHDIIQQYSNWPDIWFNEPWYKYDIGILPSEQWEDNWKESSHNFYAHTRKGVYTIGWPKADVIEQLKKGLYKEEFCKRYGIDCSKKSVLYAPAWENDGKQNDFVEAMKGLNINILVKQADWNEKLYPEQINNIKEMHELHKNTKNVIQLPPSTNIFEAIAVSDILVSEESSTMCEATMMCIPAISVYDWLIPSGNSRRFPKCDYDFVIPTSKEKLGETVKNILEEYMHYKKQATEYSQRNFANIGCTSSMIMDIIDDCVSGNPIRYDSLKSSDPQKMKCIRFVKFKIREFIIALADNYRYRYKSANIMYIILKKTRNAFRKNS